MYLTENFCVIVTNLKNLKLAILRDLVSYLLFLALNYLNSVFYCINWKYFCLWVGQMYENSFFFTPFGPGFLDILLFHFVSFLLSKDKFKEATELFNFF